MSLSDLLLGSAAEGGRDARGPLALPPTQSHGLQPPPSGNGRNPMWNAGFAQYLYVLAALQRRWKKYGINRRHVICHSVNFIIPFSDTKTFQQHLLSLPVFHTVQIFRRNAEYFLLQLCARMKLWLAVIAEYTGSNTLLLFHYFPELCRKPASHLHQSLLRQLRGLKGYRTAHIGCDRIKKAVTRARRSLKALQIGACLGVAASERPCRTDWSARAYRSQKKR